MFITVEDLMNLFVESGSIQIFVNGRGELYQFDADEVPEEIAGMAIESIDNPEYAEEVHALTININEEEFDDYQLFKREFYHYMT